ncbi:MAG: transposase, partial [Betaproteobacteria bacterium]
MRQTKKGDEWHLRKKARVLVDGEYGLTHTFVTTPANTVDVNVADQLLHKQDQSVIGDTSYRGVENRCAGRHKWPHWHVA